MGLYVFFWKGGDWAKIGHYNRNNAWSRVAHRGFNSCAPPCAAARGLTVDDLDLVAWFPSLTRRDEGRLHRAHAAVRRYEWYPKALAEEIVRSIVEGGCENRAADCDRAAALATRARL